MKTDRKRIKFQVGELDGPGNSCAFSTMATFDYEDGEIVARADGYTGRGATTYKAALDWCRARLGYDAPNPGGLGTTHKTEDHT